MEKNWPLKIHLSCLPRSVQKALKSEAVDGYIHGYFAFNERDVLVSYFSSKVLFNCTRPHTYAETHLIRCMYASVEIGVDASGRPKLELCQIIAHYSSHGG